jgi:CHAD domain-containing protein
MAFRPFQLRPGEELRNGLVRIVALIGNKAEILPGFRAGNGEAPIHEARLLVKLLRALVWMARPALEKSASHLIRKHLRSAAACLADSRDAAVLTSTLSNLSRQASGSRSQAGYALAKEVLAAKLTAPGEASVRRKLAVTARHLAQASLLFQRGAETTPRPWPSMLKRERVAARSCDKAMKRALSTCRAGDFHEWRKTAKRFLFLLRVTETAPGPARRKEVDLFDQLQSKLGDHHDLVVLEGHFRKSALLSKRRHAARNVLGHIRRRKAVLEKQTEHLGRRCHRAGAEWLEN